MTKPTRTDDSDTTGEDATVLRSNSGGGSGTADTPRVLKQRFVLEEQLGSGGMGTVYRARDLRKVEARDKNPYVAIKVLNNDFRAHPDAFIALQREASKSQAIAHPNIVSIFDFDKDGDIPYMTMELLEGKELSDLIKEYPNGLPDSILWPALEGRRPFAHSLLPRSLHHTFRVKSLGHHESEGYVQHTVSLSI